MKYHNFTTREPLKEFDMVYEFFIAECSQYSRKHIYDKLTPGEVVNQLLLSSKDHFTDDQKSIISGLLGQVRGYPDRYIFAGYGGGVQRYDANIGIDVLRDKGYNCRHDDPNNHDSRLLRDKYQQYVQNHVFESEKWKSIIEHITAGVSLPKPIIVYSKQDDAFVILEGHNRMYCYIYCFHQGIIKNMDIIVGVVDTVQGRYFMDLS